MLTVQFTDDPAAMVVGTQTTDFSVKGGSSTKSAAFAPEPVPAVTAAPTAEATCAAVAVNLTEEVPPGTVTLAGTVRLALLLANGTVKPAEGAAELSVKVHVDVAGV